MREYCFFLFSPFLAFSVYCFRACSCVGISGEKPLFVAGDAGRRGRELGADPLALPRNSEFSTLIIFLHHCEWHSLLTRCTSVASLALPSSLSRLPERQSLGWGLCPTPGPTAVCAHGPPAPGAATCHLDPHSCPS